MFNVLFVDDDIYCLEGLKRGLDFERLETGEVYWETSVENACEILEKCHIDILVSDIEMPGKNGIWLQKWIQEKELSVVTIFLTCYANFDYAKEAIRYQVFDYVLKPVQYSEMMEKLCAAVRQRRKLNRLELVQELPGEPEEDGTEEQVIDRMKVFINEHLDSELTRKEIGSSVYLNPDYAARIFKQAEGMSLSDYIKVQRINRVKQLLIGTPKSPEEISGMAGYTYNSYFCHLFKSMTGVTPVEYRRKYGGGREK